MTRFFRNSRTYGIDPSANAVAGALGTDIGRFVASQPRRPRAGMFAGRDPTKREQIAEIAHSAAELAREQQACLTPPFPKILGDPEVGRGINRAMNAAIATPNRGEGSDIPANGSEYGFLAGIFPAIGVRAGRIDTNRREHAFDFDLGKAPFPASLITPQDLTAIHVHQSPNGEPGLSELDLHVPDATAQGPGINIVAVDRNGKLYCKAVAQ